MDPHNNLANVNKKGRFLMFQTVHLEYHQQRFFTLKMHQNRWRLGLRPRPHWGSLQRSPDPLAGLRGPTSKGKGEEGGERREEEGLEGEGRGETLDHHNVGDRSTPLILSNKALLNCLCLIVLIATLKPQSNGPSYSSTVIGTLAGR